MEINKGTLLGISHISYPLNKIQGLAFLDALHSSSRERHSPQEVQQNIHKPLYFISGKMHFQLSFLLTILLCLCIRYSLVEIKPELQGNILKFGYGINSKYEGMLVHSFDRSYVITKFVLPTVDDMKLYCINYDKVSIFKKFR